MLSNRTTAENCTITETTEQPTTTEQFGKVEQSTTMETTEQPERTELSTRVAALIGNPVRHSLSPAIHNAAFEAVGIDWVYTSFEVARGGGASALDAMRTLNLAGMSVTMPLKAEVAAAADIVDSDVAALGAANCIVPVGDGKLKAANTDVVGFLSGLKHDVGITPEGRNVVLIGAGGAARAVSWGLAAAGASKVSVVNRTRSAAEVTASLAGSAGSVGSIEDVRYADIVVNATSVGMGADKHMPCDPSLLRAGQIVVDLIYSPPKTVWLQALHACGVDAYNGLSMLVFQAAAAFKMWTGIDGPVDVMCEAVLNSQINSL